MSHQSMGYCFRHTDRNCTLLAATLLYRYGPRNFLIFANTTAIAYSEDFEAPGYFLPICNGGCVRKRQKITSRVRRLLYWFLLVVRLSHESTGAITFQC